MTETVTFRGVISSTTPDGRSAIVRLDESLNGVDLAVISPATEGRYDVMNGVGKLAPNIQVTGTAVLGPDAWSALTVAPVKVPA